MKFKLQESYNDVIEISSLSDVNNIDKDHTRVKLLTGDFDVLRKLRNRSQYVTHLYIDIPKLSDVWENYSRSWVNLKEVIILSPLTEISQYMFYGASNLTKVSIHDSVETIGPRAFCYCANLSSFDFSKVTNIEFECFSHCTSLKNLDLTSVKQINQYAFEYTQLNIVKLNTTSTFISNNIFYSSNVNELILLGKGRIDADPNYWARTKYINISKDVQIGPTAAQTLQDYKDIQVRYFNEN